LKKIFASLVASAFLMGAPAIAATTAKSAVHMQKTAAKASPAPKAKATSAAKAKATPAAKKAAAPKPKATSKM